MSTIEALNLGVNVFSFFILSMLIVGVMAGGNLRHPVFRWFLLLLVFTLLGVLTEISLGALQGTTGRLAHIAAPVSDYLGYVLWGLQNFAFAKYIYEYIQTRTRISPKLIYLAAFYAVMTIVLATIAQFTQMYGWMDERNIYHPQPLFWVSAIFPTLSLLTYIVVILKNIRVLRSREWVTFVFYSIIFIVFYIISAIIPDLWISYFADAIAMFAIYINIQLELKHQAEQQKALLEEGRIALMLSQIQPHFLYNSLNAISRLCDGNPKAQQALLAFSQYLRNNMDSLSRRELIPFEKELEHTRHYLWLEELRFEERLRVEFDTPVTDFMLPTLTLQPLVENAVRYGITQKKEGGTLKIHTGQDENDFLIMVTDDGPGFDPSAPMGAGRSHTGIKNVRSRLAAQCGGTLLIESSIGKGTVATIKIPKGG